MPIGFEGNDAEGVWRQAVTALLAKKHTGLQESRLGETREILHAFLTIRNPRNRWIFSRSPGINPAFAIAEVFWILAGSNKAVDINFWNPALPRFAGKNAHYHGAYGYRLRNQFGFDQITRAYQALRANPNTRQVVLQIWDPKEDFPNEEGIPTSADIPCNISGMLKMRDGKLEWLQVMRSNDVFRGTPYNIVQFTVLQEILAGWLECDVGDYIQLCDSMHLYESDLQHFSLEPIPLNIPNNDSLAFPKVESDMIVTEMIQRLGKLASHTLTEAELSKATQSNALPQSYKNLLLIAGADSARRRGWVDCMYTMAAECSNPALQATWEKWRIAKQ
jgi:thymidylate synthase